MIKTVSDVLETKVSAAQIVLPVIVNVSCIMPAASVVPATEDEQYLGTQYCIDYLLGYGSLRVSYCEVAEAIWSLQIIG